MRRPRAQDSSARPSLANPSREFLSENDMLRSAIHVALTQAEDARQEAEDAKQEARAAKKEAKTTKKKHKVLQKSRNETFVKTYARLAGLDVEVSLEDARYAANALEAQTKLRNANDTIDIGLFTYVLGIVGKDIFTEAEITGLFVRAMQLSEGISSLYINLTLMASSVMSYDEHVQQWKKLVRASQERVQHRDQQIKVLGEEIAGLKAEEKSESLRRARLLEDHGGGETDSDIGSAVVDIVEEAGLPKLEKLVDLAEWPLPPKKTSWVVVQGERKREKKVK